MHAIVFIAHPNDVSARFAAANSSSGRSRLIFAIVCARGGYGCHRIIERLDADAFRKAAPEAQPDFPG